MGSSNLSGHSISTVPRGGFVRVGGATWWDSFYDEGGVGFIVVIRTFVDFEALRSRRGRDGDERTARGGWCDRERSKCIWTEGIVGVG